jgi:hypothetical protein
MAVPLNKLSVKGAEDRSALFMADSEAHPFICAPVVTVDHLDIQHPQGSVYGPVPCSDQYAKRRA